MKIDTCFHNLKQRFSSSEGFCYSSPTKTSFWFIWSTSDALFLGSIKSRLLPPDLSWMHYLCSNSRSRCSNGTGIPLLPVQSEETVLRKCSWNTEFQMMHMPKSFQWEITGLMFTFLISSL